MHRLSISDAALWTRRFITAEWRLLLPVALAFLALPSVLVQLAAPVGGMTPQMAMSGALIGWLLPVAVLGLVGGLAVTGLALVPGMSVGEALGRAARRLWVVLAAWVMMLAGLIVALTLFTFIGVLMGMGQGALTRLGVTLSTIALLAAVARLLMLVPVAMAESAGPWVSLRRAWALGRGHFWHLFGTCLLLLFAITLVSMAARAAIGVVTLILGRALGAEDALATIAALVLATIGAGISTGGYILVAGIYRELAGR